MIKLLFKFKTTMVLAHFPNFLGKKKSKTKKQQKNKKSQLSTGFQHHAEILRNLMIKKQTDPISQDPSGYRCGTNKYNCNSLTFKSQRYGI